MGIVWCFTFKKNALKKQGTVKMGTEASDNVKTRFLTRMIPLNSRWTNYAEFSWYSAV